MQSLFKAALLLLATEWGKTCTQTKSHSFALNLIFFLKWPTAPPPPPKKCTWNEHISLRTYHSVITRCLGCKRLWDNQFWDGALFHACSCLKTNSLHSMRIKWKVYLTTEENALWNQAVMQKKQYYTIICQLTSKVNFILILLTLYKYLDIYLIDLV